MATAEDDIDDDGGTDEGCDGVEGDDAKGAGEEAQDVAQLGNDGAGEHGGRHEETMVVGMEQQACDMWHGKSDECHGTAEGGDDGGEQSGDNEEPVTDADDVDAEVLGIAVAEHEGVKGFDEQQGCEECRDGDQREPWQHLGGDAAEGAHAPNHVGTHAFVGGKEIEQRDGGIGDVAYHDADDEEHDAIAHHGGKEEDEQHDGHGTHEGSGKDGDEARDGDAARRETAPEPEHDQGDTQSGTVIDTKDAGASQGIAEGRLEHESTDGQCTTRKRGCEGLRQSRL